MDGGDPGKRMVTPVPNEALPYRFQTLARGERVDAQAAG